MSIAAKKFFHHDEILFKEKFYLFIDTKKIITFVPSNILETLTLKMSQAGAGLIGNYEMCSFRTSGTGTFKPNIKASPFTGKKNKLSYAEEIKLEMECDSINLNKAIDVLLKIHPYEEVAYEIYSFKKRDKKSSGIVIELRNKLNLAEFVKKLNRNIEYGIINVNEKFSKIAITNLSLEENLLESARFIHCEYLLIVTKSNFKLFKL